MKRTVVMLTLTFGWDVASQHILISAAHGIPYAFARQPGILR
jgi:hypothetical protein